MIKPFIIDMSESKEKLKELTLDEMKEVAGGSDPNSLTEDSEGDASWDD